MLRWKIGDVTATKEVDLEVTGGSRFLPPQARQAAVLPMAWLQPHFAGATAGHIVRYGEAFRPVV